MIRLGGAHDRRSDKRFVEHPGKRKLSAGNASLFGELTEAVDHFTVWFFGFRIQRLAELIGLEAFCALGLPRACQTSSRERTPWKYTNALGLAERHHLSFFFAIKQIVMILHGNESRPTMAIRKIQGLRELPRVHRRCSDIANLAGLHYVVQRFKRFFDRRLVIPAVNLIQVHVVGSETTQALVEFIKDFFAREALAIRLVAHLGMHLSRDDNGFASGMCAQKSPKDLFACPRRINVGGVEKIDSQIKRLT